LIHSMFQVCCHACVKLASSITNIYIPHKFLSNKKGPTDDWAYNCWLPSKNEFGQWEERLYL
jgi:hypothetical protein